MLTWDQTGAFEVGELQAQEESPTDDWMTDHPPDQGLPSHPARQHPGGAYAHGEHQPARPGDVIIKQGDEGDYFYIVTSGRCVVTRETPTNKSRYQAC